MKKIFIFLLLLSFNSLSFAAAFNSPSIVSKLDFKKNYFDSAYVGIGAGVLHVGGDVKNTILDRFIDIDGDDIFEYTNVISNNNAVDTNFAGNIFVGFGKKFESFYLGSDLFFTYSHIDIDKARNYIMSGETIDGIESANLYSTVDLKSSYFYGFDFRLGHLIDDKSIFYALVGVEFGDFEYKVSHINEFIPDDFGEYKYSFSKTEPAIRIGIGVETFFYKNLTLRFEYVYSDYKQFESHKEIRKIIESGDEFYNSFADDKVNMSSGLLSLNLVYHIDDLKRR